MKNVICFIIFILCISCTKNEYKVNFTFNHFDVQTKKTYKSDPVDLYVIANNSNELKTVIKETLSKEYTLYTVDSININSFEISQNNKDKVINENTIYFNILDINEIYSYLNLFKKTYVFNCDLNRFFTNYSPEQHDYQEFGVVYLTIKNRNVRLIDRNNRLLMSFEIYSINELEQWKNRVNKSKFDKMNDQIILLTSNKYNRSYLTNNANMPREGHYISFLGRNQNYKNIQVNFSFVNNGNNNIDINHFFITYKKNGIIYNWTCKSY
jgi:hypothetical protein